MARSSTPMVQPDPSVIEGRKIPQLPGRLGWLNDEVGVVDPVQESWREADGAMAARLVGRSGEIYCGRRRASTASEEFNPWMSAALMLWKSCGRERPAPVDSTNPWQRGK